MLASVPLSEDKLSTWETQPHLSHNLEETRFEISKLLSIAECAELHVELCVFRGVCRRFAMEGFMCFKLSNS